MQAPGYINVMVELVEALECLAALHPVKWMQERIAARAKELKSIQLKDLDTKDIINVIEKAKNVTKQKEWHQAE